ncbi:transcription initiation factor IIB [Halolamina pelagica]|uniref:Transcription initiation factor IIB n=1 Tax=Halolamina pelagica TaxID=699431 RepID=A0A0P7GM51_9EURY|nr:transcription initiation factor IIB family protein [Halolamina pelagica]KPN29633.1 transcription initiation factor IIB [Halolamina pelagica]
MSTTRATGCPECDGRLTADGDETVCASCGLVVSTDRLDRGPEWRSFEDDDTNPARCGAPLTRSRHDRGLSTEIGRSGRGKNRKWSRLRRQHRRTQIRSKRERNQVYGFTEIRRLMGALSLPDRIRDQSCSLFESAQEADLLRGRSIEGFASAAVYAACRVAGISRTTDEILDAAKATADEHRVAYDALNRELGLPVSAAGPTEFVARYASELDLGQAVRRRARALAEQAVDSGHANGRNPSGVAAGALYLAARREGDAVTQAEAADVADVTAVTVRTTYQALRD